MLGRQALLVKTVARFVQNTEKGVAEVVKVVARRDALIARPGTGAEGMVCHVEPAGVVVEPDGGGGGFAEGLLDVDRELAS